MNKKTIYIILAVVIVAIIAVCVYFAVSGDKAQNQGGSSSQLNIEEISNNLAAQEPFSVMSTMDITTDIAESFYQISTDDIEVIYGKMPMMNVHASMFVLMKAKEGKIDFVKSRMDEYATSLEEQWSTYLPEQYDLVVNRKVGVIGDYYYMIIAENAEELEKLIK